MLIEYFTQKPPVDKQVVFEKSGLFQFFDN